MAHGNKLGGNKHHRYLRGGAEADQHGATDERVDDLSGGTYNAANKSQRSPANEEVATAKEVREAADEEETDGDSEGIGQSNPCEIFTVANISIDDSEDCSCKDKSADALNVETC